MLATISVIGSGWPGAVWADPPTFNCASWRASELNSHLREMNLFARRGSGARDAHRSTHPRHGPDDFPPKRAPAEIRKRSAPSWDETDKVTAQLNNSSTIRARPPSPPGESPPAQNWRWDSVVNELSCAPRWPTTSRKRNSLETKGEPMTIEADEQFTSPGHCSTSYLTPFRSWARTADPDFDAEGRRFRSGH